MSQKPSVECWRLFTPTQGGGRNVKQPQLPVDPTHPFTYQIIWLSLLQVLGPCAHMCTDLSRRRGPQTVHRSAVRACTLHVAESTSAGEVSPWQSHQHKHIQTDRQTDRQTERQRDRQTDRNTHTQAHTHAHTNTHVHARMHTGTE